MGDIPDDPLKGDEDQVELRRTAMARLNHFKLPKKIKHDKKVLGILFQNSSKKCSRKLSLTFSNI